MSAISGLSGTTGGGVSSSPATFERQSPGVDSGSVGPAAAVSRSEFGSA